MSIPTHSLFALPTYQHVHAHISMSKVNFTQWQEGRSVAVSSINDTSNLSKVNPKRGYLNKATASPSQNHHYTGIQSSLRSPRARSWAGVNHPIDLIRTRFQHHSRRGPQPEPKDDRNDARFQKSEGAGRS